MSTNRSTREPNTTFLPGHLRAEYPVAGLLRVQVRNIERPKRRFLVGVTDGVSFSALGQPGGFTTEVAARQVAESFVDSVA